MNAMVTENSLIYKLLGILFWIAEIIIYSVSNVQSSSGYQTMFKLSVWMCMYVRLNWMPKNKTPLLLCHGGGRVLFCLKSAYQSETEYFITSKVNCDDFWILVGFELANCHTFRANSNIGRFE